MIRLVLTEDHYLLPGALFTRTLLHTGLPVMAEVNRGPAASAAARDFRPDILPADIGSPVLNGLAKTRASDVFNVLVESVTLA